MIKQIRLALKIRQEVMDGEWVFGATDWGDDPFYLTHQKQGLHLWVCNGMRFLRFHLPGSDAKATSFNLIAKLIMWPAISRFIRTTKEANKRKGFESELDRINRLL